MNTPTTREAILDSWAHKISVIEKYSEPMRVLDHGEVRLVDLMGDDPAIVQAARTSYGNGLSKHKFDEDITEGPCAICGISRDDAFEARNDNHCLAGDRGLIRYLMRHRHTTPFEMCEIKLHVKMPIFVARQWIRHRMANTNEYSGRYAELADEFYLINVEDWRLQSDANKQGSSGVLDASRGGEFTQMSLEVQRKTYANYQALIEAGVANEIARCDLPLSLYTMWYWKTDLHNLLHFLSLRMDSHAQLEIRVYAELIGKMVQEWCPLAWEAFEDYRLGAHTFSKQEMAALRDFVTKSFGAGLGQAAKRDAMRAWADEFGFGSTRERKDFFRAVGLAQ